MDGSSGLTRRAGLRGEALRGSLHVTPQGRKSGNYRLGGKKVLKHPRLFPARPLSVKDQPGEFSFSCVQLWLRNIGQQQEKIDQEHPQCSITSASACASTWPHLHEVFSIYEALGAVFVRLDAGGPRSLQQRTDVADGEDEVGLRPATKKSLTWLHIYTYIFTCLRNVLNVRRRVMSTEMPTSSFGCDRV